jgi:excisionase family DNA binding protein
MAARINTIFERLQPAPSPRVVSVGIKAAAQLLGVSDRTVKRLVHEGRVRSQRIKGRRLIDYDSLQSLIKL